MDNQISPVELFAISYVMLSIFFVVIAIANGAYDKKPLTWGQLVLYMLLWPGWIIVWTAGFLIAGGTVAWHWLDRPIRKRRANG